jgi:hypothetical protein
MWEVWLSPRFTPFVSKDNSMLTIVPPSPLTIPADLMRTLLDECHAMAAGERTRRRRRAAWGRR